MDCSGLEVGNLVATPNSTSYPSESAVYVHCSSGYRLSGYHIIVCRNGTWDPGVPECSAVVKPSHGASSILIISVCTVASVVALIIIIFAAYMFTRNWRRARAEKKEQIEFQKDVLEFKKKIMEMSMDRMGIPDDMTDTMDKLDVMADGISESGDVPIDDSSPSPSSSPSVTRSTSPDTVQFGDIPITAASMENVIMY